MAYFGSPDVHRTMCQRLVSVSSEQRASKGVVTAVYEQECACASDGALAAVRGRAIGKPRERRVDDNTRASISVEAVVHGRGLVDSVSGLWEKVGWK